MTVDLPLCPEDIEAVLQEIIAREKFQNPEVVFAKGSAIGQGYLGVDTAVEITEGNRKLELFVKTAPKHEKFRETMHIKTAYHNEVRFYSTIYPEFDKFYREKTGKPLNIATKYYGGSDEEMKEILVMKNIRVDGFAPKNLKEPFDKDHVLAMMRTYAKLHGTSLAFNDQKKEVFEDITKDISDFLHDFMTKNSAMFNLQGRYDRLEKFLGDSASGRKILGKFKYLIDNMDKILLDVVEFNSSCSAVNHGDCNGNNLMFRNKDGDVELCLIDFQGVRVASPMADLSYAFYASCSSEENLSQLDYYLDEYYKELSTTIKELGSDPNTLYPKSLMKEHWKRYCGFALAIALPIIESSLYHVGVQFNIVDALDNPRTEEEQLQFSKDFCDNEELARRTTILFQHLIDNDFI